MERTMKNFATKIVTTLLNGRGWRHPVNIYKVLWPLEGWTTWTAFWLGQVKSTPPPFVLCGFRLLLWLLKSLLFLLLSRLFLSLCDFLKHVNSEPATVSYFMLSGVWTRKWKDKPTHLWHLGFCLYFWAFVLQFSLSVQIPLSRFQVLLQIILNTQFAKPRNTLLPDHLKQKHHL